VGVVMVEVAVGGYGGGGDGGGGGGVCIQGRKKIVSDIYSVRLHSCRTPLQQQRAFAKINNPATPR